MAEELQGLLEKIQQDGLQKADAEKKRIIAEAEKAAKALIAKAQKEAEEIKRSAEETSAQLAKRAESAVRQAARDVVLKLSGELKARLDVVLRDNVAAAMTPEFMAGIIGDLVKTFCTDPKKALTDDLTVMVPPAQLKALEGALKSSLVDSFHQTPQLFADSNLGGGLKISFSGKDLYYDFSDTTLAEIICSYIGPRLAAIVNAGN